MGDAQPQAAQRGLNPACSSGTLSYTENQLWCSYAAQKAQQREGGGQAQGRTGITALPRLLPAHPRALWRGDGGGEHGELSTIPGAEPGCSWDRRS